MSEIPTDQQRASAAAHARLLHANPLSVAQMSELVECVAGGAPRTALEFGCGAGSFAIALARRRAINITAIDTNPYALERARLDATGLRGTITFEQRAAVDHHGEPVDLVIMIGASQAFGTPREAVVRAATFVRPGGRLLFAELVWAAKPSAEFLAFLGTDENTYWHADEAAAVLASLGMTMRKELAATPDSWRDYERGVHRGRHDFAATLPPEEAARLRMRADTWFTTYEAHGRHCFGFAAYVLERRD